MVCEYCWNYAWGGKRNKAKHSYHRTFIIFSHHATESNEVQDCKDQGESWRKAGLYNKNLHAISDLALLILDSLYWKNFYSLVISSSGIFSISLMIQILIQHGSYLKEKSHVLKYQDGMVTAGS